MQQVASEMKSMEAVRPMEDFDAQIRREWLITNGRGGYASSTVLGIPTRRYHGLLVAAARPPLERWMLLSSLLERVEVGGKVFELAGYEFNRVFHPRGYEHLRAFGFSNNRELPWVRLEYAFGGMQLVKQIILSQQRDEVTVVYRLEGFPGQSVSLQVCPFVGMRDFHALARAFQPGYEMQETGGWVNLEAFSGGPRLWMTGRWSGDGSPLTFLPRSDWWYGFTYREEAARGQEDREDLFAPGWFQAEGQGTIEMEIKAVADFSAGEAKPPEAGPTMALIEPLEKEPSVEERLSEAGHAFVVLRRTDDDRDLATILAGYHWFGDWGRDTFIALPGLLLETGQFQEARQVLEVFASTLRNGLIPNRFSDYGEGRDYNSVDASLWYIHAADAYCRASGDRQSWAKVLGPTCRQIVDAFVAGTDFNIYVDHDGLVVCGEENTQLTWMDAKFGDIVFTPRHGKAVEINALWYHGLLAMAEQTEGEDPQRAGYYRELAENCRRSFTCTFWNQTCQCLYDVVREDFKDMAIRPNQIFAVSLPHSPLDAEHQESVVVSVESELLTPFGLRTLNCAHPSYCGHYEGNPCERDSVYHQGTVWGWLMGPFVEAYLRVHHFSPDAKRYMRDLMHPLIEHLNQAGVGSVSEIFDGDPPHTPRGCVAQAWSVSELLRAWRMTK